MSGAPIIGYDGAYPRELTETHGGGRFVPRGDVNALLKVVIALAGARVELAGLQKQARQDGQLFDQDSVFQHRSEILKNVLGA